MMLSVDESKLGALNRASICFASLASFAIATCFSLLLLLMDSAEDFGYLSLLSLLLLLSLIPVRALMLI